VEALREWTPINDVVEHSLALAGLARFAAGRLPQQCLEPPLRRAQPGQVKDVLRFLTPLLTDRRLLDLACSLAQGLAPVGAYNPLGRGQVTSPRIDALARLVRQYPASERAVPIEMILATLGEIAGETPKQLARYRNYARHELRKHLPELTIPELEKPHQQTPEPAAVPTFPARVVESRRGPTPEEDLAEVQRRILAIPEAPEHATTALANAFIRAKDISDEALREAALRSLVPYWRVAASARDGMSTTVFQSLVPYLPVDDLGEAARLVRPNFAHEGLRQYQHHGGFTQLLARIAARRGDLWEQLWPDLVREAADAGRATLLTYLYTLLEPLNEGERTDLALETVAALNAAVRWWP
jgi:hypothetical protein